VDIFARRLQVQERLTDQVANAIMDVVAPSAWAWCSSFASLHG